MGGPYISPQMVLELLKRLRQAGFFGSVELEIENGEVYRIKKLETMKLSEVEKVVNHK